MASIAELLFASVGMSGGLEIIHFALISAKGQVSHVSTLCTYGASRRASKQWHIASNKKCNFLSVCAIALDATMRRTFDVVN